LNAFYLVYFIMAGDMLQGQVMGALGMGGCVFGPLGGMGRALQLLLSLGAGDRLLSQGSWGMLDGAGISQITFWL